MDDRTTRLIRRALDVACNSGESAKDEAKLAIIEALLRDAFGHDHGVWRWRVPKLYRHMAAIKD